MHQATSKPKRTAIAAISIALAAVLAATGISAQAMRTETSAQAAGASTSTSTSTLTAQSQTADMSASSLVSFTDDLALKGQIGEDLLRGTLSPDVTSSRVAYMEYANPQGEEADVQFDFSFDMPAPLLAGNDSDSEGQAEEDAFTDYDMTSTSPYLSVGTHEAFFDRVDYGRATYASEFYTMLVNAHKASGFIAKDATFVLDNEDITPAKTSDNVGAIRKSANAAPAPSTPKTQAATADNDSDDEDTNNGSNDDNGNDDATGSDDDTTKYDTISVVISKIRTPNGASIVPYANAIMQYYYCAWFAYISDHPESFFASRYVPTLSLGTISGKQDRYIVRLALYNEPMNFEWRAPNWDEDQIIPLIQAQSDAADSVIAQVAAQGASTEYEKVCAINRYICDARDYLTGEAPNIVDDYRPWVALTVLTDTGSAPVCESFSRAMQLLCKKAGIGCTVATGTDSAGIGHMWNQIEVDGKWFDTDVTWNDTSLTKEAYLLVGDGEFRKNHTLTNNYYDKTTGNANVDSALWQLQLTNHPPLELLSYGETLIEKEDPIIVIPDQPFEIECGAKGYDLKAAVNEYFSGSGTMAGEFDISYIGVVYDTLGPVELELDFYCLKSQEGTYKRPFPVTIQAVVVPKQISVDATLEGSSFEATGSAITPAITVTDENGEAIDAANYTVTYADNILPGTASVTITSNPDYPYAFSVTKTFTIWSNEPTPEDQPALSINDIANAAYGDTRDLAVSGGAPNKSVTFEVTSGQSAASIEGSRITFTGVGTVKVKATSRADGYNDATAEATLNVAKRQLTANVSVDSKAYDGTKAANATTSSVSGRASWDSAEDIDVAVTAEFQDSAAGASKPVTLHYTLSGSKATSGLYEIASSQAKTTSATISQAPLPVGTTPEINIAGNLIEGAPITSSLPKTAPAGQIQGNITWYRDSAMKTAINAADKLAAGTSTLYWKWDAVGNYAGSLTGAKTIEVAAAQTQPEPQKSFRHVDDRTGIAVTANIEKAGDAILTTRLIAIEDAELAEALAQALAQAKEHNVFANGVAFAADLTIDGDAVHDSFGTITLRVPLTLADEEGNAINASKANIYHRHANGSVTSEKAPISVTDGKAYVEFTVQDLSEFAITATDEPEDPNAANGNDENGDATNGADDQGFSATGTDGNDGNYASDASRELIDGNSVPAMGDNIIQIVLFSAAFVFAAAAGIAFYRLRRRNG